MGIEGEPSFAMPSEYSGYFEGSRRKEYESHIKNPGAVQKPQKRAGRE
jgi:hypothetical protein